MARLTVSSSPHIRSSVTTQRIMLDVLIALTPAAIAGTVIFGWRALLVMAVCIGSSVLSEFVFNLICKKKQTIGDLSAVVTGLLLALNLPVSVPVWQCVIGSVFAIIVVKCLFGGLGCNFANPAIAGRVLMLICFASTVGAATVPVISLSPELVSGATPLGVMSAGGQLPPLLDLFLGLHGGAIGETCAAALLIGYVYLVVRKVIKPEIPAIFIGTVFLLSVIISGSWIDGLYHILTGGVFIGAIFMATDYVTTPITRTGKMIFAFGCGIITVLIRFFGSYPEGVSFAILIMNILSPYIEKWTAKIPLGGKKA